MAALTRYRALDHHFVVDAPEPFASIVATMLAGLAVDGPRSDDDESIPVISEADGSWRLGVGGAQSSAMGHTLARLLEHVNQMAARSVGHDVPLHGAAVSGERGVIALVGASGAGKSTLAATAIRSGWGFVAEEVAAVHPEQRAVRSYHRPIGLRRGGAAAMGLPYPAASDGRFDEVYPWVVPEADRLAGGRLVAVVLVGRSDASTLLEDIRPAAAMVDVAANTVVPDDDHLIGVFRGVERLVRSVPTVRLTYRTPQEAVAVLDEMMASWS